MGVKKTPVPALYMCDFISWKPNEMYYIKKSYTLKAKSTVADYSHLIEQQNLNMTYLQ